MRNQLSKYFPLLAGLALAVALAWIYWGMLAKLILSLAESEDYSYGLLLPLVSGYIVYLKWPQLRHGPWRPAALGLLIMAAGLAVFIVGELAAELYTTRISFMVVLAGVLLLVGGWKLLRLLAFPFILLVLMLPLPELVTYKLTLPLQLISSSVAAWILQTLGVPVLRQGNIIDLGVRQLQIVAACSGLRYILALLALGLIYCYFFQRRLWKVAVLLIALVPAAILVNAARVAGMALSPALSEGFWHGFSGWVIFLLCFAFLGLINWALNRVQPEAAPGRVTAPLPEEPPRGSRTPSLGLYLVLGLALILLAAPLVRHVGKATLVPLRQSFDKFPLRLGPWEGKHSYMDPAMVAATRSQAHLYADYKDPDHGSINLWIAYYETQKKAGGFVHSPKGCLTASGWHTIETGIYQISPALAVNYMLVDQMGSRLVVFYWFLQRGRWVTSEYLNKFYMGYDGLLRRRTDGALIRLVYPAGKDPEAAKERLASFARLLAPILPEFIPN